MENHRPLLGDDVEARDTENTEAPTQVDVFAELNKDAVARCVYFLGVAPCRPIWSCARRIAYKFYKLFSFCMHLIALPYALYMYWYQDNHIDFYTACFITAITGQSSVAWLFLANYLHWSPHFTQTMVPMLRQSNRQDVAAYWNRVSMKYMMVNVVVLVSYVVWLNLNIYPAFRGHPDKQYLRAIFYVVPMTFLYRLMVPTCLCHIFMVIIKSHLEAMEQYERRHSQPGAIVKDMLRLLKKNVANRGATEKAWAPGFLVAATWPILNLVAFTHAALRDPQFVVHGWFFPFYMVQFVMQTVWLIVLAISVSSTSKRIRANIIEGICSGDYVLEGEAIEIQAYMQFIGFTDGSFHILGVPVTVELTSKVLQSLMVLVPPLAAQILGQVYKAYLHPESAA